MKSLGEIYRDSFENKNKWYHYVYFYVAFVVIFILLAPIGIWRRLFEKRNTIVGCKNDK